MWGGHRRNPLQCNIFRVARLGDLNTGPTHYELNQGISDAPKNCLVPTVFTATELHSVAPLALT
jgi:hypothetical protein